MVTLKIGIRGELRDNAAVGQIWATRGQGSVSAMGGSVHWSTQTYAQDRQMLDTFENLDGNQTSMARKMPRTLYPCTWLRCWAAPSAEHRKSSVRAPYFNFWLWVEFCQSCVGKNETTTRGMA